MIDRVPSFFFDTADVDYISALWKKLAGVFPSSAIRGVTTNPNALHKVGINSIEGMKGRVEELCGLMSEYRPDGGAVVYVQQPNSRMDPDALREWARFVGTLGDGKTPIALKIAPFPYSLEVGRELKGVIETNVTGVADCATALRAFSYDVRYVSIIVGRMEEVGVDARSQVEFVQQRATDAAEIITGSMRTIEGLKWACQSGTVPTIGTRVWDLVLSDMPLEELPGFWKNDEAWPEIEISPTVNDAQRDLSVQFFQQMDQLGESIHREFMDANTSPRS